MKIPKFSLRLLKHDFVKFLLRLIFCHQLCPNRHLLKNRNVIEITIVE